MKKLDGKLSSLLIKRAMHAKHPQEAAYYVDPGMKLNVCVRFSGDIALLREAGFSPTDVYDDIAFGTINVQVLEELTKLDVVLAVESQRDYTIQLDNSIPEVNADDIWSRSGDSFSGYTGRDIIVGIIDTGIDFRHQNFIKPDGSSRVLYIWDQTLNPEGSESSPHPITAGPFASALGYGVEYENEEITAAIPLESGTAPVRHKDEDGHGTHVAGIAAGNGRQDGRCSGQYKYIGVAPEADLVIVRLWGLTKGDKGENQTPPTNPPITAPANGLVSAAVRYIFEIGRAEGKPVVINCSFGYFGYQMDGSSPRVATVDNLLQNNPGGRAVAWLSGNFANKNFHATGTVSANSASVFEVPFKIFSADDEERIVAIVYSGSDLEVQVTSPIGGADGTVAWTTHGGNNASHTANGTIGGGTAGTVTVDNDTDLIWIVITPPQHPPASPGDPQRNGNNVANSGSDNWKIELRNTSATPTDFHALMEGGSTHDSKSPIFLDHTVVESTLCEQASGHHIISVGSYEVGGQLAASSSRGPTLESPPRDKPDLCAPGVGITSAAGADSEAVALDDCASECCRLRYTVKSGTSMATPHVAGCIALMLHKNPLLTHADIRTLLTDNTGDPPGDAPSSDASGWGAGRLDVNETVDETAQINDPIPMSAVAPQEVMPLLAVVQRLLDTDYGGLYYDLARKYFHELFTLINTNKRVATAWHRNKGPVWTRLAINAFNDPSFRIPLTALGTPFAEGAARFLAVLKKYASRQLRMDIELYEPFVHLVRQPMTLLDLINLVGNQPPYVREAAAAKA